MGTQRRQRAVSVVCGTAKVRRKLRVANTARNDMVGG